MGIYGKVNDRRALMAGRDTGPARLPAIPMLEPDATNIASVVNALKERLEVREGSRGNDAERVVTQREFAEIKGVADALKLDKKPGEGEIVIGIGGGMSATIAVKNFQDMIRGLQLYKDLLKRLDDPSRFSDLRAEVREELLRSIANEAAKRGAEVRRTEKIINDMNLSIAIRLDEVTAAAQRASAGVRETVFATAEANRAQAGKITQIEASLGNFYQDGTPGRASLEESMTATADAVDGLSAQYTLKVQAGGALAGFGIVATEVNGVPSSAFLISADKFAIVSPTYNGGLTTAPDQASIPFGVDQYGIYMNSTVYLKGNMRIDATERKLIDGLRGSVSVQGAGSSWSDTAARLAVWTAIGKTGVPENNAHLVIGDTVTIGSGQSAVTLMWDGSQWSNPGLVLNGDLLVNGSVAASKVDTTGLIVRDQWGVPIFGAGVPIPEQYLNNAKPNITTNPSTTKVLVNGQPMLVSDFVNRLSKIDSSNISTFMASAAIGNAYIGNAAVETLQVAGGAITSMAQGERSSIVNIQPGGQVELCACTIATAAGGSGVAIMAFVNVIPVGGNSGVGLTIYRGATALRYSGTSMPNGYRTAAYVAAFDGNPPAGYTTYRLVAANLEGYAIDIHLAHIMATGGKR